MNVEPGRLAARYLSRKLFPAGQLLAFAAVAQESQWSSLFACAGTKAQSDDHCERRPPVFGRSQNNAIQFSKASSGGGGGRRLRGWPPVVAPPPPAPDSSRSGTILPPPPPSHNRSLFRFPSLAARRTVAEWRRNQTIRMIRPQTET